MDGPHEDEDALAIATLLRHLPEMVPIVDELEGDFGDTPTAQMVFSELAGITVNLFGGDFDDEHEDRLEHIFEAIEHVASTPDIDVVATVAWSFLDCLDPGTLVRCSSYLGPVTERILELLLDDSLTLEAVLLPDV